MSAPEPRLPASFGSLLSVTEFANAGPASLTPVCAVQGCQVALISFNADRATIPRPSEYRARAYGAPLAGTGPDVAPVPNLTHQVNHLRDQVLAQVRDHAARESADMVIGLEAVETAFDAGRVQADLHTRAQRRRASNRTYVTQDTRVFEMQMAGTAVRGPGASPAPVAGPGKGLPALCTLSSVEIAKLAAGGWQAVDVVVGASFWRATRVNEGWGARELAPLTDSWRHARTEVHNELEAQLKSLRADGIVGLSIDTTEERVEAAREGAWPLRIVGVTAIGTAIRRIDTSAQPPTPERMLVLR